MKPLERYTVVAATVGLIVALASYANAAVLCGRRDGRTGQIADGASLKLRTACKSNELPVDASTLGLGAVSGFIVRTGNTVSTNVVLSSSANCEPGEFATGGGVLALGNDGGLPVMRSSRPQPDTPGTTPTGWRVTEVNSAATGTITATTYVVCAVP